jgi:RNA-directed DNA polymerase
MLHTTILDLDAQEALFFFLDSKIYCSLDFPPYIAFGSLLNTINDFLSNHPDILKHVHPENYENVNYIIASNKDGKYDWRPFELINPILYVQLVRRITEETHWQDICNRFKDFAANPDIECMSIPVVENTLQTNQKAQILAWWENIEQRSIELSLDYEYLIETDITNCYGALYTHSIAWALHTKERAKQQRRENLIGNIIDKYIRAMRYGQTNGIPQGSVLMDFIAEMVLGYIDTLLSDRIKANNITDYHILRYRDDYKIFVNNPHTGEHILKIITEILAEFGMKPNISKTNTYDNIILHAIKKDKLAWLIKKQSNKDLQKHLLLIYKHALEYPHAGSLITPLQDCYFRIKKGKRLQNHSKSLIAIIVDIAYRNPRTYSICAAMLSVLLTKLSSKNDQEEIITKIKNKFSLIPNTSSMLIWLQRISLFFKFDINYNDALCRLIDHAFKEMDNNSLSDTDINQIWNMDWVSSKELKKILQKETIINTTEFKKLSREILLKEIEASLMRNY